MIAPVLGQASKVASPARQVCWRCQLALVRSPGRGGRTIAIVMRLGLKAPVATRSLQLPKPPALGPWYERQDTKASRDGID